MSTEEPRSMTPEEVRQFCQEAEMKMLEAMVNAGFTMEDMQEIEQCIADEFGLEMAEQPIH